eukprot:GHUV01029092.1.p1 GENE.GHUV01029092.1~~GHUV01029092.1.p1  ORF type:complete len:271 (-),score=63.14 GHUV01029092.1:103-915(-)
MAFMCSTACCRAAEGCMSALARLSWWLPVKQHAVNPSDGLFAVGKNQCLHHRSLAVGEVLLLNVLPQMATVLSSLTQLVLAETPGMTLTNVRGFPSLRVLDLSRVESLTPASLQAAVESFTALEQLLLDNCHTLATLKLNMPHLRVSSANHVGDVRAATVVFACDSSGSAAVYCECRLGHPEACSQLRLTVFFLLPSCCGSQEISLRGCGSLVDLDLNCWRLAVLGLGPLSRGAPGNSTLQRLAVTSGALKKMEWIQCRSAVLCLCWCNA